MDEAWVLLGQTLFHLFVFISFSVTALYALTKYKAFVDFLAAKKPKIKSQIITILFLGVLIILASKYAIIIMGARVNVRDCIAIFAGILAGPAAGIIVGLIGGIYRITLGGWTAIPCGLATMGAGMIGAYLYKYKGYKINSITLKQIGIIVIIMGIWEFIHVDILAPILGEKPILEALSIMNPNIILPMALLNMIGIAILLLVCKDAKDLRESIKIKEDAIRADAKAKKLLEKKIKERIVEIEKSKVKLQSKVYELEKFNKLTVGRELRMVELKKEIKRLKEDLTKKRYEK